MRAVNQDAFRAEDVPERAAAALVLCDGMGGERAGEVASETAAGAFAEYALERFSDDVPYRKSGDGCRDEPRKTENHSACGNDRPGSQGAAHIRKLCRKKHTHIQRRVHIRQGKGCRRNG